MKYQIFISYREEDKNVQFAKVLYDKLIDDKYSVFLDDKNLKSGKFDEVILAALNECQDFILLLTPGSLTKRKKEDWVYKEISIALKNGKNIIPIALYDLNEFPQDLNKEIEDLKRYRIIKVIGNNSFWVELFERTTSHQHLLPFKTKLVCKENPFIKYISNTMKLTGILWGLAYIGFCLIHYKFQYSWNLPVILWNICKSYYGLSILQITGLHLSQGLVFWLIWCWIKNNSITYIKSVNEIYNIDIDDFNAPTDYACAKLDSWQYKKGVKREIHYKNTDKGENCFWGNLGVTLSFLHEQYAMYFFIDCRMWTKGSICGVGSKITKKMAITIMEGQNIKYIRRQNDILRFEIDDIDINIWYGSIFPRAIEMKRKHIESNLDDYIFFRNYSFIDENNIEYNIYPLGQFQHNGQIYVMTQLTFKNKKIDRYMVIRKDEGDYIIVTEQKEVREVLEAFNEIARMRKESI